MVKVEKVFKEKEYYKNKPQAPTFEQFSGFGPSFLGNPILRSLGDSGQVMDAFSKAPVKNALAVIGAITVLYIGFKFAGKFAKIKENLKRI